MSENSSSEQSSSDSDSQGRKGYLTERHYVDKEKAKKLTMPSQQESDSNSDSESQGNQKPKSMASDMFGQKSFKELQVSQWLINNLETVGIVKPTLI